MLSPNEKFLARLRQLESHRIKYEDLLARGHISTSGIHFAYESLFLAAFVAFENFIEEEFIFLLTGGKIAGRRRAAARIVFSNRRKAREFVYGGRRYVDWLPYNQTIQRAKLFFNGDGYPFTKVGSIDIEILLDLHAIRNAIAHLSRHAQKNFENRIDARLLRPSEKRPAPYLRSNFSIGVNRYQSSVGDLVRISNVIDSI